MGQIVQYVPADQRALILPGVPADHTYTFGVRAFRRVHRDINAAGVLKSGTALSSAYKPTVAPVFRGDILGTIQGRDSLSVVQNLENIASDSVLSTTEKPGLILEYNRATSQRSALDARAAALGAYQTERDAASAALTALDSYLSSLTPAWNNTAVHTPINASTFQSRWASLYAALANLDAAITGRQGDPGPQGPQGSTGPAGPAGVNTATIYLYKRSTTAPTKPSTATTYTFSTGSATGFNNGWTLTVPAGTDPLYVTTATAASSSATDTIAGSEWSSPTVLAQNGTVGATGAAGAPGLNSATIYLYKRSAAQPPEVLLNDKTYTFSTGQLNSVGNGWSQTVPAADGNPLWVSTASAASTNDTDTVSSAEWSVPTIMAQDGATGPQGPAGPTGVNSATIYIFKRSATAPSLPSATTTYTFASAALTGLNNGWTTSVPSGTDPLYVAVGSASSSAATDTIATNEWTAPAILAQNGANGSTGSTGAPGVNSATIYLYRRASSTPSLPSTTSTYTFASATLTGQNNSWTQTIPAANGNPLYVTTATAASTAATDTIASGEWAAPQILAQDGPTGPVGPTGPTGSTGDRSLIIILWKRSTTLPIGPTNQAVWNFATRSFDTSPNNGWSLEFPAVTGAVGRVYSVTASISSPNSSVSIPSGLWTAPVAGIGGIGSLDVFDYADLSYTTGTLPVTRADAGLRNANQTWAEVSGTGRPSDGATDDLGLRSIQGSATINGNTYTNTSALGWVGHVTSDVIAGSVKARARVEHATARAFLGLYDSAGLNGNSYINLDYSIYLDGAGGYQAYENGVPNNLNQSGVVGDILEVEYLQDKVKYWITPVSTGVAELKREVAAPAGKTFRLSSCAYYTAPDARSTPFSRISFTPTSDDTSVLRAGVAASNAAPAGFNFGDLNEGTIDALFRGNDASLAGYTLSNSVVAFNPSYTEFSAANNAVGLRQFLPIGPNDIWEVEVVYEVSSGSSSVRLGFFGWDNAGTNVNFNDQEAAIVASSGSIQTRKMRIGGDNVSSSVVTRKAAATATRFVPHFRFNAGSTANVKIYSFRATRLNAYSATDIDESTSRRWAAESGADITKSITGATPVLVAYESDGTTLKSGEIPKSTTFRLQSAAGTVVSSGVVWSVSTLSGTWVSTVPSMTGTGTGSLKLNSGPAVSEVNLNVQATYEGRTYSFPVKVQRSIAAATSSGGGSGGNDFASDSSMSSIGNTTFVTVSDDLTVTTKVGSTSVALTASISLQPANPSTAGSTVIEMKWQWWNGSSWVDTGSVATSSPHPSAIDEGGFLSPELGQISCNATKTGLTANTSYKFRLMGRRVSGATNTIASYGTASAQG